MISLTIKSLKPSFSFPIQAHLTDSVAHLKSLIASSSQASTPSVESQRLLLKGKALTDAKLLKEYEEFKDGATVTLVIKPGAAMTATSRMETQQQATAPAPPSLTVTENADGNTGANATTRAPTARAMNDADISVPPLGPGPSSTTAAPANEDLHEKLASISFWRKIHDVCREELGGDHGKEAASVRADEVTLMFLKSVGDRLSAGEIAKVQDALGIDGEWIWRKAFSLIHLACFKILSSHAARGRLCSCRKGLAASGPRSFSGVLLERVVVVVMVIGRAISQQSPPRMPTFRCRDPIDPFRTRH